MKGEEYPHLSGSINNRDVACWQNQRGDDVVPRQGKSLE
jgi:hypothetical protein